jgi:aspartate kinase
MRIFKFGGASVKDAEAIQNVGKLIQANGDQPLVVVISAMGKTTNRLEELLQAQLDGGSNTKDILEDLKKFHFDILAELMDDWKRYFYEIDNLFVELECLLESLEVTDNYHFAYDQVVCFGEIISTKIISTYLNYAGIHNRWIDVRNFIITTNDYRKGRVNWDKTEQLIANRLKPLALKQVTITQGFIARSEENQTSTLGREGSDYTGAILSYCLNAESLTIWKDVPGVMNADPKRFSDAILIPQLNYRKSIELAYYGASVIHPKTLQPLEHKSIPLYVKSFKNPEAEGTCINNDQSVSLNHPCYIVKDRQVLLSLSTKDFSFIVEEHLGRIFRTLASHNIQINAMQNSALSFSVLINESRELDHLINQLNQEFDVDVSKELELLTVFNHGGLPLPKEYQKTSLLEQRTETVWQQAFSK